MVYLTFTVGHTIECTFRISRVLFHGFVGDVMNLVIE